MGDAEGIRTADPYAGQQVMSIGPRCDSVDGTGGYVEELDVRARNCSAIGGRDVTLQECRAGGLAPEQGGCKEDNYREQSTETGLASIIAPPACTTWEGMHVVRASSLEQRHHRSRCQLLLPGFTRGGSVRFVRHWGSNFFFRTVS
jgi:hypothetical protein